MASKIKVQLRTKYVTRGGHIVTVVKRCTCGSFVCQVRKNDKFVEPRDGAYTGERMSYKGRPIEKPVHYERDGRCERVSANKSAFDIVAVWEE